MASIRPSGTQFFWPNVSLESVERECKRNGDGYKPGFQEGVQGYWITVAKHQISKEKARLSVPITKRDHRIRSASPILPADNTTPRPTEEKGIGSSKNNQKTPSEENTAKGSRPVPLRRLSAILLEHLKSSSADDSTSIWEGSTTGARYEYLQGEMLGKGSFGEVRKVSVKGYEGSVARKSMFLQSRNKRQIQKEKDRIQREVENLQRARHKHVVNILDCYTEQEKNFTTYNLIMSPVGDKDLETLLDKFPRMSVTDQAKYRKRISRWFHCLASALAYMHQQGIRHEDIKPNNIIHRGDTVYFTDFSSSRVFKPDFETATTSTVETTRRFAAPEVLNTYDDEIHIRSGNAIKTTGKDGKVTYEVPHGRQSDVFSLALVFAEMTTVFNKSVAELHASVLVVENSKRTPLYHEVIDRLGNWFAKELKSERGLKLWQSCLRFMLNEKRTSRPSALTVLHTLQRERPVGKIVDDGCQALLPPAPKIRIESPRGNNQETSGTQDTKPTMKTTKAPRVDTKDEGINEPIPKLADNGMTRRKANGVDAVKPVQTSKNRQPRKKEINTTGRKT
jgi:serine/threonine protein kinase